MNKCKAELPPLGKMLRRSDIVRCTGLSSTTLWRLEKSGKFPARVKLTEGGSVGWSEQAVREWLESRQPVNDAA